jgi:hypothetical protein
MPAPKSPPTSAPVLPAVLRSHSVSIPVTGIRSGCGSRSSTISAALCSRSIASRRTCPMLETRTHWLSLNASNIDGCAGIGCGVCATPKAGKTMRRARSRMCLSMAGGRVRDTRSMLGPRDRTVTFRRSRLDHGTCSAMVWLPLAWLPLADRRPCPKTKAQRCSSWALPSWARAEGRAHKKTAAPSAAVWPLLGSNQDSPDPESSRPGRDFGQLVGNRPLSEHRCPLPCRSLPGFARRNYGKTTASSSAAHHAATAGVAFAGLARHIPVVRPALCLQ